MYPGRGPLSPARLGRCRGRRRGRARGGHRRRCRGPVARSARRHPRVPARRARDPRDRRLLRRALARRPYASEFELLPLYARLSVEEQQRVFAPSRGRRIVLATNVAETSLTVPGIRYVIDSGLARVKRYCCATRRRCCRSRRSRRRRPTSAPGAAAACGRHLRAPVRRGRFRGAAALTDPEILRSSLAAVILRMAALALGDVAAFPFLDPPSPRAIADGYQLLQELDAVDAARALTPLGRELARLPLDPRDRPHRARRARRRMPRRGARHRQRALRAGSARAAARARAGSRPGASAVSRRALRFPVADRAVGVLRRARRRRRCRIASASTRAARTSSRSCG